MHRRSRHTNFVHVVWSTKRRARLLEREYDGWITDSIRSFVRALGCDAVAVGIGEDHVHVLLRFPTTCRIADAVQRMKGATAFEWNRTAPTRLVWQEGFWCETVGPAAVNGLARYLGRERTHHAHTRAHEPWEDDRSPDDDR